MPPRVIQKLVSSPMSPWSGKPIADDIIIMIHRMMHDIMLYRYRILSEVSHELQGLELGKWTDCQTTST